MTAPQPCVEALSTSHTELQNARWEDEDQPLHPAVQELKHEMHDEGNAGLEHPSSAVALPCLTALLGQGSRPSQLPPAGGYSSVAGSTHPEAVALLPAVGNRLCQPSRSLQPNTDMRGAFCIETLAQPELQAFAGCSSSLGLGASYCSPDSGLDEHPARQSRCARPAASAALSGTESADAAANIPGSAPLLASESLPHPCAPAMQAGNMRQLSRKRPISPSACDLVAFQPDACTAVSETDPSRAPFLSDPMFASLLEEMSSWQ